MVKILGGLLAAAAVAAAGYFGFEFYVQQRVASDVEAAFATVRQSGAKASHGKVSFDLWSRTVTVADISGESAAQPPVSVKIGRFTASGVRQPDAGRFSADRIEATEVDFAGAMATKVPLTFTYKAPRIEIANYTGPAGPLRQLDPSAPADIHRFVFEHFAAVSAASVIAPRLTGSMSGATVHGTADYSYAGVAMRDIREGRIATMTIDKFTFTAPLVAGGKADKMTGEVADIAAYDFDAAATLAMFDPARAKDDKYVRAYRQMKFGAYTASFESGIKLRIDGMVADDIGIKPSKLQFRQLMAIAESAPPPGTTPTPAQTRDMLGKAADLYDGILVGGAEVKGLSIETPNGPFQLAVIRLGRLENGKLAEFALEGLDARAPEGPVKIGRFALKSLDIANMVRMSAQLTTPGQQPSPEQLAALLLLLDGGEIRDLVAPYKNSGRPVRVDTFTIGWGQFVGPIPTRARIALAMSGPVDSSDPDPFKMLAAAGMTSATINLDVGAAWNESGRSFAAEPITIEVGSVGSAAARLSVANVPREAFSLNPLQAAVVAAQIEAGPMEIALRDTGGVDLFVAQYARTQKLSSDAARRAIADNIKATGMTMAAVNPDAMAIAGALARFVEIPRGTLTVKLTPKGKVEMMGLIKSVGANPLAALAQFQVDASVGR
jgi:hypothetical protein